MDKLVLNIYSDYKNIKELKINFKKYYKNLQKNFKIFNYKIKNILNSIK